MKLNFNSQVLNLPGLNGSGQAHWQTLWEKENPAIRRVETQNWDHPQKDLWVKNLETAVASFPDGRVVLIAHSLGCLQVAHWAQSSSLKIKGAFRVAPPNADRPDFPEAALSFRGFSRRKFPFSSMLVASSNDPYCALDYAQELARDWGSEFVNVGAKKHINALSQLGNWPQGFELFIRFVESLG